MGSWIHDGFLDSWNPCVKDFRILDLLESIIGFNKSFVQWAGIEVKNKKLMPISKMVSMGMQVLMNCVSLSFHTYFPTSGE